MNAWQSWLSIGLILIGSSVRGEEKPSENADPTHCYYAVFKGLKKGAPRRGLFEVQGEWTLQGGLKKLESKIMEVPVGDSFHAEVKQIGWVSPNWHLNFREDARGMKKGYPDPYFWTDDFARVGTTFTATVSSVSKTDDGRAKVDLLLLEERSSSEEGEGEVKKTAKQKAKPKGTATILWDESRGPTPVIKGQQVVARVTPQGEVLLVNYASSVRLWRKTPDGKIEIAVNPDPDPKKPSSGLLLLKPTGLQQGSASVEWFPRLGVFLFEGAAGDPTLDPTALPGDKSGIQLLNVPDLRIRVGRDGWQRAKQSSEGYWENCPEVPESQVTSGAG